MTNHCFLAAAGILLGLAPGLLCPPSAAATGILDQSQPNSQSSSNVSSAPKAQIFTAGMYGRLDCISVYLENWPNPPAGAILTVSVQTVIEGLPSGKQIGSGTVPLSAIPPSGNPGWIDVSISGAVVTNETQYALTLQTSSFATVDWWFAYTSYSGRTALSNDGIAWRIDTGHNFTFKTYVTPDVRDQYGIYAWTGGLTNSTHGQTFTAGLSGRLDRVSVYVESFGVVGDFEASIQTVKGGYPSGIVLGQGSIPASSIPAQGHPGSPGWVTIGISGGVAVTAGTQYALVLRVGGGLFSWMFTDRDLYPGGHMIFNSNQGWTVNPYPSDYRASFDAIFETYVVMPVAPTPAPEPPPRITPCSSGVCPVVAGIVTPPDSTARVTSNVVFQEFLDGRVHGILNFNDSRTGNFVLQGCTTASTACRLTVTTFACTDQHAITVAGTYTPQGETAGDYRLTLSGVRGGIGTFTLSADDYTYTLTRYGIVDVTCPPGAGDVAGQR